MTISKNSPTPAYLWFTPYLNNMTFDLRNVYNEKRPFSWSAKSSFGWNPKQWYHKYVVHGLCTYADPIKGTIAMCVVVGFADPECPVVKKTIELAFGSMIDERIQNDLTFIPSLVRYPIMQHKMKATFNGIPLVGIIDTYQTLGQITTGKKGRLKNQFIMPSIRDYKTGRNKWDQKRTDETGQLTFYTFLEYLNNKTRPEDVDLYIDWLPTHTVAGKVEFLHDPVVPITFKTKRDMHSVLKFGEEINETWKKMQAFGEQQEKFSSNSLSDW